MTIMMIDYYDVGASEEDVAKELVESLATIFSDYGVKNVRTHVETSSRVNNKLNSYLLVELGSKSIVVKLSQVSCEYVKVDVFFQDMNDDWLSRDYFVGKFELEIHRISNVAKDIFNKVINKTFKLEDLLGIG